MTITPPSAIHCNLKSAYVGVDIVKALIGSGAVTDISINEANWRVHLLSTYSGLIPCQCPNDDQEAFHDLSSFSVVAF